MSTTTTMAATAGACCAGRGRLNERGTRRGSEPAGDRFDGFQIPPGGGDGADALTARLEGGIGGAVRLGSPAEVAAAIPHFFGFHPDASLVVLGLSRSDEDGRAAINHGLRVDLESVVQNPASFGRWMAARLKDTGANEALCVLYPPEGGPARMSDYRRMVAGMTAPLRIENVPPLDVLFISDGRWWSFLCDRSTCCPPEGSPVDAGASAVAALSAYSGLAVLPNRATLAAGLEPYGGDMPERMRAACDAALRRIAADHVEAEPGAEPVTFDPAHAPRRVHEFDWGDVARAWQLADSLCDGQVPPDRALNDEAAGELLVALRDVRVRDYLATWCADDRAGQAVALSVELARRSVTPEQAASAFAIAAWAAWSLGWGAWSRLCLERAAAAVPGYALTSLIKQGLERGVGPELVREAARATARRLDEMRADHAAAVARGPHPAQMLAGMIVDGSSPFDPLMPDDEPARPTESDDGVAVAEPGRDPMATPQADEPGALPREQ
jgi:hypothetical protein